MEVLASLCASTCIYLEPLLAVFHWLSYPNLRALLFSLQDALRFRVSLVPTFGFVFANKMGFTLFLLT